MENASKALIIAGAILLAIVIISLGLIVVNNVRDTVDNTNLSEQEIQSFNAKFTAYEGDNVSGSRVNSLIQQVIATNQASYKEGKTNQFVQIGFKSISGTDSLPWLWIYMNSNGQILERVGARDDTKYITKWDDDAVKISSGDKSYTVSLGKNYKVEIKKYTNGLVSAIKATPES